ncbi:hypothetical protein Ciccas_007347 [Cichlidogyrus casuarinus]|uniref:C2H2-type domain-containing protein n=1 Tax=Cichlidogyrus casuarinus TaxID=1844966 RepID=A0ABD2Q357_9PLAT
MPQLCASSPGPISVQVPMSSQGLKITAPVQAKNCFKCAECGHSFRQKVHLRKHILNHHSKHKPFQCPYCAYTTVERSHLTVHIRTHTGEKPYMCRVCDYTSTQNCTLKSHYLRRHPQSKVHCSLCDKDFVTEQERDNHQKSCLEHKSLFGFADHTQVLTNP